MALLSPTPSAFRRACRPGRSGTEGTSTAAADRHRFRTTAGHTFVWVLYLCTCGLRSSPTRRLPPTSPSLAGWPGVRGRGTRAAVSIIPLGSCSGGGPAGRTAAAAGSGWSCWLSQERSAPSPSRVLCCRLCPTSQERKKKGMERSGPTPCDFPLSAWPAGSWPYGSGAGKQTDVL